MTNNIELYFAYGSNINLKQMKQRCPSVQFHSRAILRGHRLVFPIRSERWGGGVAGIVPEQEEQVEGVVYEISKGDLKRLDNFEGVDEERYYRRKEGVLLPDGANIEAWVYFANLEEGWPFPPSKKYIDTIIEGAREHNLSEQFIKDLKNNGARKMLSKDRFNKEVQNIVEQLIRLYKPLKVILFGSLVNGKLSAGTDIDLFVIKEDVPNLGVDRIRQLDRLIRYRIATDFIVYKPEEVKHRLSLGDHFVKSIFKEGKILYNAE